MAKLIAKHTVKYGGAFFPPGAEIEVEDDHAVGLLIARGAADRKTRVVVDDEDDDEPKTVAEVIAMADEKGVSFKTFRKAAVVHLGDETPAKKPDIVEALKALAAQQSLL